MAADADNEFMMIDATIVRAHQHSAGAQKKDGENQAIGRSRGGLTTKIHAVVDALGNPVALSLTPGQAASITQAAPLLDEVEPDAFIGDKGYDWDALVEKLEQRGITPVIPPRANRKESRETDFGIATRYDKLANTFLTGVLPMAQLTTRSWKRLASRHRTTGAARSLNG